MKNTIIWGGRLFDDFWVAKNIEKKRISISKGAASRRARATGKGREGVNPSPGTGDWEFFAKRIYSTRLEAQGLGGLGIGGN